MSFDPDWVIAPSQTLKDWREENRLGIRSAATTCAMTPEEYERVEAGKRKITITVAAKLAYGTGIPGKLWLNLERVYRAGLAAGKADVT